MAYLNVFMKLFIGMIFPESMHEVVEKARTLALQEIQKYGVPLLDHFEIANRKGQELAKKEKVDADIVLLGTILMDLKLGKCMKEGKVEEHTRRSMVAALRIISSLPSEKQKKIINCIEAHHKQVPFLCKEAEVVANADCYRFLHPQGVFPYIKALDRRYKSFQDALLQVEKKMDEKWSILTLKDCRKELKPYYLSFKELLQKAK